MKFKSVGALYLVAQRSLEIQESLLYFLAHGCAPFGGALDIEPRDVEDSVVITGLVFNKVACTVDVGLEAFDGLV